MNIIYTLIAVSFFALASCSSEPTYSQAAKDKAMELIEAASVITSGTESGISFMNYAKAVDKYNSTLDMFLNFAPNDLDSDVEEALIDAKESWIWTRRIWARKIDLGRDDYDIILHSDSFQFEWGYAPELWKMSLIKCTESKVDWHIGQPYFASVGSTLGVGGAYFEIAKPFLLKILK
jgi:hypothetical protein